MATVRLFAGARAAAGVSELCAEGNTVAEVLASAVEQYADLGRVLPICSVLLDGLVVHDHETSVSSNALIDVLPPFAGG